MFYNNDDFRQENSFGYDEGIDININNNNINNNQNTNENYNYNNINNMQMPFSAPIVEPGRERCVQRRIVHEVQHICPINTRIINNHIYRHTYQPRFTCTEENIVTNEQCESCCNFK